MHTRRAVKILLKKIFSVCRSFIFFVKICQFFSTLQTSVSETTRKPPLVKAQTALKTKKNKIWRKTMFNIADGILTPCNVARS